MSTPATDTTATENTATAPATRKEKFHFRPVPIKNEDAVAKLLALVEAGKIKVLEKKDETTDALVSIQREAVEAALPVIDLLELVEASPKFVEDLVHGLVANTARKMFVDAGETVGEITIADVIKCNTAQTRQAIPQALVVEFANWVGAGLTEQGQPAGTVGTFKALITGKFNSAVCSKYSKLAEQFPQVLEIIKSYAASSPEATDKYGMIADLLDTNLTNWTKEQLTANDTLDLSGFSV